MVKRLVCAFDDQAVWTSKSKHAAEIYLLKELISSGDR